MHSKLLNNHSVHRTLSSGEAGGWKSNQIFEKEGGLTGPQLLEGVCWKRGGDLFGRGGGGLQFSHKNKLKSEIFYGKKSLWAKIFFSVITMNSKWEISNKNLVTFKRWDCVKDKIFLVFTENSHFKEWVWYPNAHYDNLGSFS